MARSRQFLSADFREAGNAIGVISGVAKTMRTNKYMSDVIVYAHERMAAEFDYHMDALYAAAPDMFHHVYDWNSLGGRQGGMNRLWRHDLIGTGASRNASWSWIASKKPVPTPTERANNPNDPMSSLPPEQIAKFSNRTYFFYWKAPVMEFGRPVSIEPKYGKVIAFPTWDPESPIVFSKGLRVIDPGGDKTTGAFTAAWTSWWSMEAPRIFEEVIAPVVENDITVVSEAGIRSGQRMRNKTVQISAFAGYEDAMQVGEDWAERALYKKSTAYRRRRNK